MSRERLVAHFEKLELPLGEYAIFGGGCLAVRNLRDFNDVDLFVSQELYKELRGNGWRETHKFDRTPYLIENIAGIEHQAFHIWEADGWQPDPESYIRFPEVIAGLPFMPLRALYEWKVDTRRPKDIEDAALIEAYWQ